MGVRRVRRARELREVYKISGRARQIREGELRIGQWSTDGQFDRYGLEVYMCETRTWVVGAICESVGASSVSVGCLRSWRKSVHIMECGLQVRVRRRVSA